MATSATVLHNQSLLDFAIHHTGSVMNAFLIAKENGLAVSDEIAAGTDLIIPEEVEIDADILNYYKTKGIQPATAISARRTTGGFPEPDPDGISYWAIYDDFIVQ